MRRILLILLLCAPVAVQAKPCLEEAAALQKKYGDIEVRPAKSDQIPVGNSSVTLKRLEGLSFKTHGDFNGIHGRLGLLCQDGQAIGLIMRLKTEMTQAAFEKHLSTFGTPMTCNDKSIVAEGARRAIPGVTTCGMFRIKNNLVYLHEQGMVLFIDMPELEFALEKQ